MTNDGNMRKCRALMTHLALLPILQSQNLPRGLSERSKGQSTFLLAQLNDVIEILQDDSF